MLRAYEDTIKDLSNEELKEELEYFKIGCGKPTDYKGDCSYIGIRNGRKIKVYCQNCKRKIKSIENEIQKRKNS